MTIYDYLDRELATKKILRGWNDRIFKRARSSERIELIHTRLTKTTGGVGSTPVKGGGSSKEEQLVNGIDAIIMLEREINDADAVQRTVEICWDRLTKEEQTCLREMFIDNEDRQGYRRVMDALHVEKTEAYNRVDSALKRLAALLFW